jgi:hypothetical protein
MVVSVVAAWLLLSPFFGMLVAAIAAALVVVFAIVRVGR